MKSIKTFLGIACACCSLLALQSCSNETPTSNNTGEEVITGAHFVQAKLNGTVVTSQDQAVGATHTQQYMTGHNEGVQGAYLVTQHYGFTRATLVGTKLVVDSAYRSLVIGFIRMFAEQPFDSEIDSLLMTAGPVTFGSQDKKLNGVEIEWLDANGKEWSSAWGSGDQTGSSFIVTSHEKTNSPFIQTGRFESKGTFNCKLYDKQGNTMTVTDGKFALNTVFQ